MAFPEFRSGTGKSLAPFEKKIVGPIHEGFYFVEFELLERFVEVFCLDENSSHTLELEGISFLLSNAVVAKDQYLMDTLVKLK